MGSPPSTIDLMMPQKAVLPQQSSKLRFINKTFIGKMTTTKKRVAAVAATKSMSAANAKKQRSQTKPTSTTTKKSTITATKKSTSASNNDDDYPKPGDKGFYQHLYCPDRIKTEEDWYVYNYYVAPKNVPPPWESKDSRRVFCAVCGIVYQRGAMSNSLAIKTHCSHVHHKNNVKNNPLTKVIVKGQTVSTVDKDGNRIGSVRKGGMLGVTVAPVPTSSTTSEKAAAIRITSKPITTTEKETFDTKFKDLVLSSADLFKGYKSNTSQFRSFCELLRPGYSPISGTAIQRSLLQLKSGHIEHTSSILSAQCIALAVFSVDRLLVVKGRFIDKSFHLKSVFLAMFILVQLIKLKITPLLSYSIKSLESS